MSRSSHSSISFVVVLSALYVFSVFVVGVFEGYWVDTRFVVLYTHTDCMNCRVFTSWMKITMYVARCVARPSILLILGWTTFVPDNEI